MLYKKMSFGTQIITHIPAASFEPFAAAARCLGADRIQMVMVLVKGRQGRVLFEWSWQGGQSVPAIVVHKRLMTAMRRAQWRLIEHGGDLQVVAFYV